MSSSSSRERRKRARKEDEKKEEKKEERKDDKKDERKVERAARIPERLDRRDRDRDTRDRRFERPAQGIQGRERIRPGQHQERLMPPQRYGATGRGSAYPNYNQQARDKERLLQKTVNRQEVCPFLLRVFIGKGQFHKPENFDRDCQDIKAHQVHVYAWKDSTLREILQSVQEKSPEAFQDQKLDVRFSMVKLQEKEAGKAKLKELGRLDNARRGRDTPEDRITLSSCGFEIGDVIDLCLQVPEALPADEPAD